MTSFDGIIEFVSVAETEGFSTAARRLGVSTSHISRKVAALEAKLGVALFARSTRKVRLTEAGQQYFYRCQDMVNGLEAANETLTGDQLSLSGILKISAAGEFAEQYIAPVLIKFAALHPELTLDIDFNSRMVDFVEEGVDFSIRYGRLTDSTLIARKLVDRSLIAAASPRYLEQYGIPKHPKELSKHHCLVANSDVWLFEQDQKPFEIRVKAKLKTNSGRCLVKACEHGLGIAYMPRSSFAGSIEKGQLQALLDPYWTQGLTTWIVYANRKFVPARARLAIAYLQEHFKDWRE